MAEKILVVDDDLDTLRLVGLMLERQGYEIVAASNGQQGLSLAKREIPDLILLDLMMPDISGTEVARQLRSDPDLESILIIMFTAKTQLEDKLEGFDVGADDYVTKPIQPRELIAHVKAVLKRGKRTQPDRVQTLTERGHVVGIIAAKGGVGVSTVAMNLGFALRGMDKDVIVADYRPGCGTIGLGLGFEKPLGLNHLLERTASAVDAGVIEPELVAHASGVRFLLSSPFPRDAVFCAAADSFEAITLGLAYLAPCVILDLGVSLTEVNERVMQYCDQIIIVLEPVEHTLIQSKSLNEDLVTSGITKNRIEAILVNRLRLGIQLSFGQVKQIYDGEITGIFTAVPDLAYRASNKNQPIIALQPDGVTAQQFSNLAKRIIQKGT